MLQIKKQSDTTMLDVLTDQFIQMQRKLSKKDINFCICFKNGQNQFIPEYHRDLEELKIQYKPSLDVSER